MNILVVDDDVLIQRVLKECLKESYSLTPALNYNDAVKAFDEAEIEGALIDINFKGDSKTGIDLLKWIRERFPDLPVVMISGENSSQIIVECIQMGANDFIEKPFEGETLRLRLKKAFVESRRSRVLRRAFDLSRSQHPIIGSGPGIERARSMVERAGKMRILFHGETGVGKTPFAWYSNQLVAKEERQPRAFEQINCAGLNKEHFQDQLFGHKKGGFTGAVSDKKGLVELASGGDLFLDEIGEMPLDTQALFLTFIDSQEYYRLGDDQKRKADVRILCATNRDLKKMVADGSFRKDLYSRISQVVVDIPPLRNRPSDIEELLRHFIHLFSGFDKPYTPELLSLLQRYTWEEGNVRELRDTAEYLCIMGRTESCLTIEHLPDRLHPIQMVQEFSEKPTELKADWIHDAAEYGLENCLNNVEKVILEHYIKEFGGVTDPMIARLKTSKPTLYRRLKRYNIPLLEMH